MTIYSYKSGLSGRSQKKVSTVRDSLMDDDDDDDEEEEQEETEGTEEELLDEPKNVKATEIDVDLSKYDNVPLEDIHLDVRPRIKNIIEELYTEHDWLWPPAPPKDIRKLRFFKRKKSKMLYNKEMMDFATFLSIIIGPMELYVAIVFTIMPKTFILAMRECVEITALIIVIFFVQGIYHIYAGILGLALRASRPFEIGFVYPHWRFQVACPLLAMFCIFAAMYMTQDWMLEKEMMTHLKGYNFHWYSKHMWDSYQSFMRCCGVHSFKDWKYHGPVIYDVKRERTLGVPESCCYISNCSLSPNEDNVYSGCFDKTVYTFWTLYIIGGICVGLSCILLCLGHKSIQESSRYNGDPIHKLLFDDRWSRKRLHNRSNRREELFSLLNHYCLILGKELGFDEEVEEARKEEAQRQREHLEMEQETAFYENLDSYAGNSPPTPNSATDIVDDLHYPPHHIELPPPPPSCAEHPHNEIKEYKRANDKILEETERENKIIKVHNVIEWKPSLNPVNDEFPLRSEKSFRAQHPEFTVLPTLIKMDANTKGNLILKALEDGKMLHHGLVPTGELVTEIPKIHRLSTKPLLSGPCGANVYPKGAFEGTSSVKLQGNSGESAGAAPEDGNETPRNVRFLDDSDNNSESSSQLKTGPNTNIEETEAIKVDSVAAFQMDVSPSKNLYQLDNQVVSIVSLGHESPLDEAHATPSVESRLSHPLSENISVTHTLVEETSSYLAFNDVPDPSSAIDLHGSREAEILAENVRKSIGNESSAGNQDEFHDFAEPQESIEPPSLSDKVNMALSRINLANIFPSSDKGLPESSLTSEPDTSNDSTEENATANEPTPMLEMVSPGSDDKVHDNTQAILDRGKYSKIPLHIKVAPAYFKSALEQAQAQTKLGFGGKEQLELKAGMDKIFTTALRPTTNVIVEKPKPSEAFKEMVAALNKSSSLAKLQQIGTNEKKNLELKKSHEFDGFTPTSTLKAQKVKKIPTVVPTGSRSPKQNIPVVSKVNFPKRVGETVTSEDNDQHGQLTPRTGKETRLPKRSQPTKR